MNFTNHGGGRTRFGLNTGAKFDDPGRQESPQHSLRGRRNGLASKARIFDPNEALRSLVEIENWPEAVALLQQLPVLAFLWHHDSGNVKRVWDKIESASDCRITDSYRDDWLNPDACLLGLFELGELLAETNHSAEAAGIFDALILHHEKTRNHAELASSLDWRARLHWQFSEFDAALQLLKLEERVCREHSDVIGLAQALNNQALLFEDCDEIEKAEALYRESERLHRRINDQDGLAMNLCNQARLLADRAQTREALEVLAEVERLGAKTGNDEVWARCLMLTSELLADIGRTGEACDFASRGYRLAERIHHKPLLEALGAFLAQFG